jgi:hypothetical protein
MKDFVQHTLLGPLLEAPVAGVWYYVPDEPEHEDPGDSAESP